MQKSCTIQWEFQHLNMLCVSTAIYILFLELTGHQFLHTCFPADSACFQRSVYKVYSEGNYTLPQGLFVFFFCVCISCVPLYSTNYAVPCVCVPAASFLCMSAFFRSLHTSNKFWTAYTLLCIILLYIFEYVHCRIHICICENLSLNYM